jgi:hypothetical protein
MGLLFMAVVAGAFAYQRHRVSSELTRMQEAVAESRQEARGLFEEIGVPPQSTPLSGLEISSKSREQDVKWRQTPTSFVLSQKWDAAGDFSTVADWFRTKLVAKGWTDTQSGVAKPDLPKFVRGKWTVVVEQGKAFVDGPTPHVEFLVSLQYDYIDESSAQK